MYLCIFNFDLTSSGAKTQASFQKWAFQGGGKCRGADFPLSQQCSSAPDTSPSLLQLRMF